MTNAATETFVAQLDLLPAADMRRPDRDELAALGLASGSASVHFSSNTDEWPTPQDFFDKCNAEFALELDVCADDANHKCPRYFTRETNGLAQDWAPARCWMNPPYGREIGDWMRKAWIEAQRGALVVCLVPARTDTAWWHDYAMRGTVRFIRGRLRFGNAEASAPFPSALVIFSQQNNTVRDAAQPRSL